MHNDFRSTIFLSRLVTMPAGTDQRTLKSLYSSWLRQSNLSLFRTAQEEESRTLLKDLLHCSALFQEACDRYSINALFRAIYGWSIKDNYVIKAMYTNWESVYRCGYIRKIWTSCR
jgi:hypothetical protein